MATEVNFLEEIKGCGLAYYREGIAITERLAIIATLSQAQNWQIVILDNLASIAYRNMVDLPYLRFSVHGPGHALFFIHSSLLL